MTSQHTFFILRSWNVMKKYWLHILQTLSMISIYNAIMFGGNILIHVYTHLKCVSDQWLFYIFSYGLWWCNQFFFICFIFAPRCAIMCYELTLKTYWWTRIEISENSERCVRSLMMTLGHKELFIFIHESRLSHNIRFSLIQTEERYEL